MDRDQEIAERFKRGDNITLLSRDFGISRQRISQIAHGFSVYRTGPGRHARTVESDALAPKIIELRNQGMTWYQIDVALGKGRNYSWRFAKDRKLDLPAKLKPQILPISRAAHGRHVRYVRRRATMGGGKITKPEWELVKRTFGQKCFYCGTKAKKLTMDHFVPLKSGGKHAASNIRPACRECNCLKGRRDPVDFALKRGRLCW